MEVTHPQVQVMADAVAEFAREFFYHRPTKNLLLMGNAGCGKSRAAKRLHRWATANASAAFDTRLWDAKGSYPESVLCYWPEVTEGFYKGVFDVTQSFIEADLLVIDDIGAERDPKELAKDKLCQILSRRERRYTVITTNIQPEHWAEKWEERIADRLLRNMNVIDMTQVPSFATI